MKQVVVEKAGGYDKLLIKETATPQPVKNEILIECKACGVNFADCCVRMGVYSSAKVFVGWPIVPGFEVSGVITAIGPEVISFSPGQKVIAVTRFGGYTSHLIVPEEQVIPLPESLDFAQGASFPTVFLTAYYALFELAHVKKGENILVHSAAGGVGGALLQLGKIIGVNAVGVVGSTHKIDAVKHCVGKVIDKSKQNLWEEAEKIAPEGYQAIFDANGVETLKESYHHLSPGGKLVVYGFHTMLPKGKGKVDWLKAIWAYINTPRFNPLNMTMDNHSVMAFNLSYLFNKLNLLQEGINQMTQWFNEGRIVPPPITTYPLEEAAEAQRALETGETIGKLVLLP